MITPFLAWMAGKHLRATGETEEGRLSWENHPKTPQDSQKKP